jgi:2-amino-4-hydroxy-6-hydroxymethyldihydropteridine diphosphokinase
MGTTTQQSRRVFVALGSNLGASVDVLREAVARISQLAQCMNFKTSSLYRSAPFATDSEQPDYINAVVAFDTALDTDSLWAKLVAIESNLGRVRTRERNAARTIDIDLLMVGDEQRASDSLTLPHPRMSERAFVLLPLLEIAPDIEIVGKGRAAIYAAQLAHQRIERLKDTHLCS